MMCPADSPLLIPSPPPLRSIPSICSYSLFLTVPAPDACRPPTLSYVPFPAEIFLRDQRPLLWIGELRARDVLDDLCFFSLSFFLSCFIFPC